MSQEPEFEKEVQVSTPNAAVDASDLPTFCVVSAVYNVDRFLADFTSALDRQTIDHNRLRVIAVDDGSTDASQRTLKNWADRSDIDVTVIEQVNAGQGAARNRGLELVDDADWVTFIDPDDFVADDYFERISDFLVAHPDAIMAVGHQHDYFDDGREEQIDRHPLRFRFAGGNQLVDLDRFPRFIHMHAASTCFRVKTLLSLDLRFDSRIQPNFEDGHLVAMYLISQRNRLVGFVGDAGYSYRRRADGSSTLQTMGSDPRKYTDVLEFGYLDVLRKSAEMGDVPRWLQNTIIYELTWILRAEESMFGATAGADSEVCSSFHALMLEIRPFLDDILVDSFDLTKRSASQREALRHGYDPENWRWDKVYVERLDEGRGLVKLTYRFTGEVPRECFLVRGLPIEPRHAKTRDLTYLQRTLLHERTVWLWSDGEIEVRLDGTSVPLTFAWPRPNRLTMRRSEVQSKLGRKLNSKTSVARKTVPAHERLASLSLFRRMFKDAWVLMDRGPDAHDNAEHLFKYLRKNRRDINAWFVVSKDSPDFRRLKAEGYKRVVAHGSLLWKIMCLNATHIVSSHANGHVYRPFSRRGKWDWKFIFLQHGVIKDDLSRWLVGKQIDGFVATTRDEYSSICGEGSEYDLSSHEVVLSGLPRYDRLVGLADKFENAPRKIVIMPTWRQFLVGDVDPGTGLPALISDFSNTDYCQKWSALLRSVELRSIAQSHDLKIVLMPHPNITPYIHLFNVPEYISTASYETHDVQNILADAALVVTDYSSIAFDAAMIRKPSVYFQFDRDAVFGGAHTTRRGYFNYESDGFGPVCETVDDFETALPALLAEPGVLQPEYAARVEATFPPADGKNCQRTVAFIESLDKKLTRKQACTPVPTPPAPLRYPEAVERSAKPAAVLESIA